MTHLRAPDAGIRLVLARHGETPSNLSRILDTVPPGPDLTDSGRAQAEALADRFGEGKIVSVHASRAVRAQQTAAPLARRVGLDVVVVDGLHEVYVGDLEGRGDDASRERFDAVYDGWHHGHLDERMPGGESGHEALARFYAAAQPVLDGATDGVVVIVSHGALLRLVANRLVSEVSAQRAGESYLPNTGAIVLDADMDTPTGWRCVDWDGLAEA